MKQKFPITILILAVLILSACGSGEATPEIRAEDVAASAVAQAWLVMTQTAAAVPTATPEPPTATPQPLNTLPPTMALLPTLPAATIGVAATPTPDCIEIPEPEPKGTQVNVEFYNESGNGLNLSFGMNFPNDKNECYAYAFTLGAGDVLPTKVLAGCYYGWAWIGGADGSIAKSGDKMLCLTDASIVYKILITSERVDFK